MPMTATNSQGKSGLRQRLVAASLALLACSSCATPFGYSIRIAGGVDHADDGDEIYFQAKRVEGLGSGLFSLVLPTDWKKRSRRPVSPGFASLEDPIAARWVEGDTSLPHTKRASEGLTFPGDWYGEVGFLALEQEPLEREGRVFESPSPGTYDDIHARLSEGQDCYVLVPERGHLKRGFDLYGATGPPIVWVHLGHVNVDSGEGPFAYGLARSVGALAWGLDQTWGVASYLLAVGPMGPFGGFMVLAEPLSNFIPETPW